MQTLNCKCLVVRECVITVPIVSGFIPVLKVELGKSVPTVRHKLPQFMLAEMNDNFDVIFVLQVKPGFSLCFGSG